jgi:uncharacterized membrane protein YfcA
MHMTWGAWILGLVIGFLIGLTGMGGGAMMTPILVWTGWAPPAVAVGTDLVWNAFTKILGAAVHYREKNVNLRLVRRLATGSIPGALLGVYALGILQKKAGGIYVDHLIVRLLGGTLITVAISIVLREHIQRRYPHRSEKLIGDETLGSWQIPVIGFIVGVLVAFTSVGSGSLIITSLLLLFPGEPLKRLIGSDVFHGVLLVGVAAFGHWHFGRVDVPLVSGLLVGSLPGVWLGSLLSGRIPERALRPIVAMLLFITGVKLI